MKNIIFITMIIFTFSHIIEKTKAGSVGDVIYATVGTAEDTFEDIADYLHKVKKNFK